MKRYFPVNTGGSEADPERFPVSTRNCGGTSSGSRRPIRYWSSSLYFGWSYQSLKTPSPVSSMNEPYINDREL